VNMKTKSENMRLFEEARALKENVRSGLHRKATNGALTESQSRCVTLSKKTDLSPEKKDCG